MSTPENQAEKHYIGAPAVDYLTLTTFHESAFKVLRGLAASVTDGAFKGGRRMQYAGEEAPGYFAGQAAQDQKPHWMVRATGALAMDVAVLTHEATAEIRATRCSRIDVQITVPLPSSLRLADVGQKLAEGKYGQFKNGGKKPKVNIIRDGDGQLDTVYIGSRSSPRFFRIYVKDIEEALFLRFEGEFKEDLAQQAWGRVRLEGPEALGGVLRSELDTLPVGFVAALGPVYAACGEGSSSRLETVHAQPAWERQLHWVRRQVAPTLEKLLASPGRDDVRQLLSDLLENF